MPFVLREAVTHKTDEFLEKLHYRRALTPPSFFENLIASLWGHIDVCAFEYPQYKGKFTTVPNTKEYVFFQKWNNICDKSLINDHKSY